MGGLMKLGQLHSLHKRLFCIVLLAIVPVLLLSLLMVQDRYHEARTEAVAASHALALRYAEKGAALFDRARILMQEMAVLSTLHGQRGRTCNDTLRALSRQYPLYGTITLSNFDGTPLCSSSPADAQAVAV